MARKPRIKSEDQVDYLPAKYTAEEQATINNAIAILDNTIRGESMVDPDNAGNYLKLKLQSYPYEVFAALFLDTKHRVIAFTEIFRGTVDGAEVHPREVAREALKHNAAAIILAHNHPSGNSEPSAADRAVTARLKQSLALLDIRVLDHFVIGDGAPTSMARRGWL
jgi:DNA repair protein RadC